MPSGGWIVRAKHGGVGRKSPSRALERHLSSLPSYALPDDFCIFQVLLKSLLDIIRSKK